LSGARPSARQVASLGRITRRRWALYPGMSLETAILVTAFAFLSAGFFLSGRKGPSLASFLHPGTDTALDDALFRPVLLFVTKAPVAHC
jgi:hypothetical protein